MSSRLVTRLALAATSTLLGACALLAPRTPSIEATQLFIAYRVVVGCVDSVAGLAGFDPTVQASIDRASRRWTLVVRQPAPAVEGAEAHQLRLEFGLAPGGDSVRIVRALAATFRYRAPGTTPVQAASQPLAAPAPVAIGAAAW
ncbi:MAG TPA: hypothetical protein VEA99_11685, partial [Gemmatimonadaceae bacterium]|nr:hypothetical protein [Gemmatimonadaceae bacterium]